MKATLAGDDKPSTVVIQDGGDAFKDKGRSRKTVLIVGAVVGLACFLVIVGVTVGTFYLGMRTERHSVKEAWVNYKTADNDTIIKERVVVRGNEVDIRRPGVIRMVIDYDTNRLVLQSDEQLDGDEDVLCYVYDFQDGTFGTKHAEEETIASAQGTQTVPTAEMFTFESTGVELEPEELSPVAREMCAGATIIVVRETKDQGARRKRGCSYRCSYSCSGYRGCGWYCGIKCTYTWG